MALSASESALLTETCENMNIAANTCREVLEMLRNLGNTGVVDIATHNNASDAHANVASLAHISDNEKLVIGPVNYCNSKNTHQQDTLQTFRTAGAGGFYSVGGSALGASCWAMCSNKGTSYAPTFSAAFLETDANGDISTGVHNRNFGGLRAYYQYLDGQGNVASRNISITSHYDGLLFSGGATVDKNCGNWLMLTADTNSSKQTYYFSGTCIVPLNGITASLGISNFPFDTAYFSTAATVVSDRREKTGIKSLDTNIVDFIKSLNPVQFTLNVGKQQILSSDENGNPTDIKVIPGTRHHWGFIAQEVQEALASAGYDSSDCAVWSLADKDDPDSKQALRYEELIAPLVKAVQVLAAKVEALEGK